MSLLYLLRLNWRAQHIDRSNLDLDHIDLTEFICETYSFHDMGLLLKCIKVSPYMSLSGSNQTWLSFIWEVCLVVQQQQEPDWQEFERTSRSSHWTSCSNASANTHGFRNPDKTFTVHRRTPEHPGFWKQETSLTSISDWCSCFWLTAYEVQQRAISPNFSPQEARCWSFSFLLSFKDFTWTDHSAVLHM